MTSPTTTAPAGANQYGQGLAVVGIGGLFLSFDIPLIDLSQSGFWTVLFVRGMLTAVFCVLVFLLEKRLRPNAERKLIPGREGWLVWACFSAGALTFVTAIFNTSAGNVVFILAFNSMFAAGLSWILMGERPRRATAIAIPFTILGVALIIGSGFDSGHWLGDLMALATAFFTATGLTIARRSRRDMRFAAALGTLPPALIALPFVAAGGIQSEQIGWLALNGGLVIPIAMTCLALGPMFVPAPVVSMGYLIETTLAPVWVWLIFDDRPSDLAMVGGAIVVATLVVHSIVEFSAARRAENRRRFANIRRV